MGKVAVSERQKPGPKSAKVKRSDSKEKLKIHNMKPKKTKNFSNYFADPLIVPRVEDYLEDIKDKMLVDVDDMVDDLMKMYKDYARKKRGPFKAIVEKAFAHVLKKYSQNNISSNITDESEEDFDDPDPYEAGEDMEDEEEDEEEEDEEEEDDDGEISAMEDEDDDELEEEELFEDATGAKKSNHVKSGSSMFMNDKKTPQRNGTQELINISSDESDKETSKKTNISKAKSTSAKGPVTISKQSIPSAPKVNVRTVGTSAAPANSSTYGNQSAAALLAKRKQLASTMAKFQQSGSTSHALEFPIKTRTCVKFSDVGGCSKVLEEISQFLLHLRHPEVYQYLGVIPPRGFLLHGPPGTGKTLVARAIAGELKLPLIQVAAPELIKGISGSSEERIRHLFDQAVSIAPCILFLDEVDAITPRRDYAQREMERRIVAQLLSSMDELTTTHNGNKVLVIGATNRPDSIDPALRRAGRFDREICLGIPDRNARKEILSILTTKLRVSPSVCLDKIAASTPGYVGADLRALITEASIAAVERLFGDKNNKEKSIEKVNEVVVPIVQKEISVIELTAKDEEMKDLSSVKDSNNEENIDKTFHNSGGEPVAKTRKVDTDSSSTSEVQISSEISDDKEEKKDCAEVQEGNKDDDKSEKKEASKPEASCSEASKPEVVSEETAKNNEADVINVEDEDNEKPDKVDVEAIEVIKISSLLHMSQPLTSKQLKSLVVEECDFKSAMKIVQPSAKREGFATVPDVSWDDIGSLKHIHDELQMMIMAPVRYPEAFSSLGLRTSSGVLLCGPPGCGKTLVAKAVANEADINFISVKGPELLNMYVGESERAVRQCFLRARNSQPCVIFFDELDAICPKRSDTSEGGASMRVVNQLLTEMDGVEGRHGVFVMGASNRPDIIDPAVLRPGRLDKVLFIGLPTPDDRVDILKALTKNGTRPALHEDVSLEELGRSQLCTNFTGADLSSLVHEAGVEALMEYMDNASEGPIKVSAKHFQSAFRKVRPSVSEQDQKHYEKLRLKYSSVSQSESTMEVSESY